MLQICRIAAALFALTIPAVAAAADDAPGLWLNPSVAVGLDADTAVEVETAQRFRNAADGPDTYFLRLWLVQDLTDRLSIGGAVERRINDSGADETRLIQQLNGKSGIWRGRLRLEQRFVDGAAQTAWRLRPRAGVNVPLDADKKWRGIGDAEGFFTLRSTRAGGQTGLTGLRTQIGVAHALTDQIGVSLTYLRNQDIIDGRPDRVGHAPLLAIEYAF